MPACQWGLIELLKFESVVSCLSAFAKIEINDSWKLSVFNARWLQGAVLREEIDESTKIEKLGSCIIRKAILGPDFELSNIELCAQASCSPRSL